MALQRALTAHDVCPYAAAASNVLCIPTRDVGAACTAACECVCVYRHVCGVQFKLLCVGLA